MFHLYNRLVDKFVTRKNSFVDIGKELNQRKFRNDYHTLTVNLIFTVNWLSDRLKEFFQPYDLTAQQFNILRILRGNKAPLSTLQIRDRMIDRMSDIPRLIDRLIKKGMVEKKINIADKRMVDISITHKGLDVLSEIDSYQEELDNIVSKVTDQQAKNMNYFLDKLRGWE
jgi:DNA-binding MarR family transcriptional regulator